MKPRVTFVTPVYARDLDRFCLLRESIERCGIDIPHLAVVQTEDMPRFRDIPHQRHLQLLSTEEVLGRSVDRRRRAWGVRRRSLLYWTTRRPIHGWVSQQLAKLASSEFVETDGIVCLDSDLFFIDRAVPEDFYDADGRLHLYQTSDDLDVEMAEWQARSFRFFDQSLRGQPVRKFVHAPACLHRQILREMHKTIEEKYRRPWVDAFVDARLTEYATYGVFASQAQWQRLVTPVRPGLAIYYWWPEQVDRFADDFLDRVGQGPEKIVLIQSNVCRDTGQFRSLIEQAWSQRSGPNQHHRDAIADPSEVVAPGNRPMLSAG